jgi:Ni/Co efflux regulator RcnB
MGRRIRILAAAAMAFTLAGGDAAMARDHGDRGRGQDRRESRGYDRGGYDRGRFESRPHFEYRGRERGERRSDRGWRDDPREYAPPPVRYAPPMRRGGYAPPDYRDGAVADYGRFRLRAPPRGYVWVRTGRGYAMVSTETGQVFDVVPY